MQNNTMTPAQADALNREILAFNAGDYANMSELDRHMVDCDEAYALGDLGRSLMERYPVGSDAFNDGAEMAKESRKALMAIGW